MNVHVDPSSDRKSDQLEGTGSRDRDPLIAAIGYLSRHHGRAVTEGAISAGLPLVDGRMTVALFDRACRRAGLESEAVHRALDEIPQIVLPMVVFTSEGVRILVAHDMTAGNVSLIDPLNEQAAQNFTRADFGSVYSGFGFFVRPHVANTASRADVTDLVQPHWFWSVVKRFRSNYLHIAIAAFIINFIALAFPIFTMVVYDRVLPNYAISSLVALAIGVVIAFVFDFVLRVARSRMIDMTGKQADVVIASNIFEQVVSLRMKEKPQSVGVLANQIRDFDSVRDFFTSATLISVTDLIFAFIFIAILFLIVGPLAWIPLALLPIVLVVGALIQRPLDRAMRLLQAESAARHGVLIESLVGLETVKSIGAEGRMQTLWERSVGASARSSEDVHYWSSMALTLSNTIQQFALLAMMVWGVFLVINNTITVGALIAANMLAGRVLGPLTNIAALIARGSQTIVAMRAIDRLMKLETERTRGKVYTARQICQGAVEFDNVTFRYPNAVRDAISQVSFKIKPGERVGIVGQIGSGKTTVGRLMIALYEPDQGRILIDGADVRQYDPSDLRAGIGFGLQEVDLFYGTLRENISISKPFASDPEVLEAARLAGVEAFAAQHPHGYDMMLQEGGKGLSGGQRQSIALARVLLRKPKILFLDEPTSALDMKSEAEFCERLDASLSPDTSLIVCTHRVSLLRFVQRLIVFENGRIAVDGPRDAVLTALRRGGQQGPSSMVG